MKNFIKLCAAVVMLITACNSDRTRAFIPGTYVNSAGSEYSLANDTLVIEPSEGNNFIIHRRTGFQVLNNGKLGNLEYETEEWNALYDQDSNVLTETSKGKLITFYPEANKLLVGKRAYKKLN